MYSLTTLKPKVLNVPSLVKETGLVAELEHTISLRFKGIILRDLRLEVSVYNVYITNQLKAIFARGAGGGG